jgi:uncharacterized membrane protein YhiD involved in acid resistance
LASSAAARSLGRGSTSGLTTAATIWVSAAIGLASGLGAFLARGVTLLIALGTLTVLERFETRFFPAKNIKTLYLVYQDKNFDYGLLERELAGVKIAVGGWTSRRPSPPTA